MVSEFGTWGLSWLAGSLTTLSPCVFPILPMVLGSSVQGHRWGPVAMGLGMALSFAGVGVLVHDRNMLRCNRKLSRRGCDRTALFTCKQDTFGNDEGAACQ